MIDCGASRVALGAFHLSNGALRCDHLALASFPVGAGAEATWLDHTITALNSLGAKADCHGPAVLILPPHLVLLKHITVPRVEPAQRDRVIRFEVEQSLPAIAGIIWDTVKAGEGEAGEVLLLAAAKQAVVAPLCAAARIAGFEIHAMLPSVLATRAADELARPGADDRLLVLNAGARSATLLQVDGTQFAVRSWNLGAPPVADVESFARRLAQEVTRSLLYFQRQQKLASPTRIILTGGASQGSGLADLVGAKVNLPVTYLTVAGAMELSPEAAASGETFPGLPELTGAAALQLLPGRATLNLLPPALYRHARWRRRRPWLVAAGLLVLGAFIPPLIHWQKQVAAEQVDPSARQDSQISGRAGAATAQENGAESAAPAVDRADGLLRIQLAGYFGSGDDYLIALVSSGSEVTLLVRVGQYIEELGLTMEAFEVRKVSVESGEPWPVYEVAGFATLREEVTGEEQMLDTRSGSFLEVSRPEVEVAGRDLKFSTSHIPGVANHGPSLLHE